MRLVITSALGLCFLTAVMAVILFGGAGTIHYPEAVALLVVFVGASLVVTIDLLRRDRALLERRISFGPASETRPAQIAIQICTMLGFLSLLAVPALDYRFSGGSHVPRAVEAIGLVLVIVGFVMIARVYRANSYAAATITHAEGQTVISSGPYARVRHPMYQGALFIFAGVPLALGSYLGFIPAVVTVFFLVLRLLDEERFLATSLSGYTGYLARVRWRLVPGVF